MTLALYRTYRPGRFADVIGQEHVTAPLMRALATDRVHHAYLFSGPRGCGKTSSARILARSLNCENGPTAEPCGKCQSCIDLAPNGPGSLDVIELDAASNRGIDQARELRDQAMYAPASSRYRIYIIDEAHQLTSEAANALLKLVEEPPPHLRFVFATTEPEKLLGTIRSRTHHYPFRLVPTAVLAEHLARVCAAEGVPADPAALALAARAGAGSVRDALSVLGQLVGGAGDSGITYEAAITQLGFTSDALLDSFIDAMSGNDGAAMFLVIERVISAGHDPRRFATDLLERLRDLIILQAAPSAAEHGLIAQPADRIQTLAEQAGLLGAAALSRAADLVSDAITALRGASAPRLHLELLAARLLVTAGDGNLAAIVARLDAIERQVTSGAASAITAAPAAAPATKPAPPAKLSALRKGTAAAATPEVAATDAVPPPAESPAVEPTAPAKRGASAPAAKAAPPATEPANAVHGEPVDLPAIQALWSAVAEAVKGEGGPLAAAAVSQAWPTAATPTSLTVAFGNVGAMTMAKNRGFEKLFSDAIAQVSQRRINVEFVHDPERSAPPADPSSSSSLRPRPLADAAPVAPPSDDDEEVDTATEARLIADKLGGTIIDEYEEKPTKKSKK